MASSTKERTSHRFRCTECGWGTSKWVGRCGECQQWGTVVEAAEREGIARTTVAERIDPTRRAQRITEISSESAHHQPTTIGELDRVLGGGIIPGAAILLSGEPGVGKSTLLIETASRVAASGQTVLYVTAEESVSQVHLRARRTGSLSPELFLAAETTLGAILGQVDEVSPALVIVDSVQTVTSENTDGIAGGPAQVRDVANTLVRMAKQRGCALLLVGHVTKEGAIAGPRTLEHLVDVVCHFEGDKQSSLRFLRTIKNRFGPTDEVGCFQMAEQGIEEVPDPSELFLTRHDDATAGTCVTIAVEGQRVLPVEIQALVVETNAPMPRRVTQGVDSARVAMILAILQRRAGLPLSSRDVYVSTVGGVRLDEPSADLAIAIAIASALSDRPVPRTVAAYGELSLAGGIRPSLNEKKRSAEARRLGYTQILSPSNQKTLPEALRLVLRAAA
ncbi:MAG TPA: DNA repair protein RadA [Pseudoclavibacter sp.]|nr:DNA repair protein RadA [Pseudoclavibacter sp.]